ncbi:MAG: hypothetical protein JNK79_00180 [Chitinophagaceae bacterium]|nr:hypothetical protein [Chitinophagaceae bacterium]
MYKLLYALLLLIPIWAHSQEGNNKIRTKSYHTLVYRISTATAGCVYGTRQSNTYGVHREHLKDKAVIFLDKINKGSQHFEIELESRYSGSFTINPAKVSLMYFPTFYGRNDLRKISIN